jgi:hypothetical protein
MPSGTFATATLTPAIASLRSGGGIVTRVVGMRQILQLTRILQQIVQRHVARGVELVERARVAVLRRAEPADELVTAIHDGAVEGAQSEVRRTVRASGGAQSRLTQLFRIHTGVGLDDAQVRQLLQCAADRPVLVERVQSVPAVQGAVARRARAPAWAIARRLDHHRTQASSLEVRIPPVHLVVAQAGAGEQGGREVEM